MWLLLFPSKKTIHGRPKCMTILDYGPKIYSGTVEKLTFLNIPLVIIQLYNLLIS